MVQASANHTRIASSDQRALALAEINRIENSADRLTQAERAEIARLKEIAFPKPGSVRALEAELEGHKSMLALTSQCARHFAKKSLIAGRDFKARRIGPNDYKCQRITARTYLESWAAIRATVARVEAELASQSQTFAIAAE